MYFLKNELELSRVSQNYFQFVLAREKIYLLLFKKKSQTYSPDAVHSAQSLDKSVIGTEVVLIFASKAEN